MRALLFPAAFRRFPGNLRAALWRQVLGALLSALRAERFRSGVFAVINDGVGVLASGNSRNLTDFRYRYAKLAFCRFRVGEGRREQNAIGSTIGGDVVRGVIALISPTCPRTAGGTSTEAFAVARALLFRALRRRDR